MPTPKAGYWLEGIRIPSVTQILSRFKDSGGLIYWANQEGLAGRNCYDTSKKAADAGTLCHEMIDGDIRGHPVKVRDQPLDIYENAAHAFKAYLEWKRRVDLKINQSELQLISKKHRFGGTLDAMLVGGKLILGDWKTSNAIYPDHLIQVAGGYALLWQENYPKLKLEGVEILRVSKPENNGDPISFHDHYWGPEVIPMAQRQFLLLREAYDLDKRIKGLL
jgi:hypothetical protein